MTRLGSLVFCAALGIGAALISCGCGSSGGSGGAGGGGVGGGGAGGGGAGSGGTTGSGGSSATTDILSLVLRDNGVAGWTVDPSNSKTAGMVAATATDELSVEHLIDGASADFYAIYSPTNFAWQNYVNATFTAAHVSSSDFNFPTGAQVYVYILQLPTAADAAGLYASLIPTSLYVGKTFTDPSSPLVGTGSRIADTGDHWWINAYKGNYYFEVSLGPSYSLDFTPGDAVTKAEAFKFANAVAGKF
jgi:hypothetical protein